MTGVGSATEHRSSLGSGGMPPRAESVQIPARTDPESRRWLERLSAGGGERTVAIEELHSVLLRAATFEVRRRGATLSMVRGREAEDLAQQAADDALVAILGKLEDFRGESRFTTWAYKFALYEAGALVRKRAWRGRELPVDADEWPQLADPGPAPQREVETSAMIAAIREEIESALSPHQREVLVALALNEVPIDVLAERLNTTRGALYKALHDARKRLRLALASRGMSLEQHQAEEAE
jgi:RNA polymerase sigma-70 factor (ECF subfamily)